MDAIALSTDGQLLAAGGQDGSIHLWDTTNHQLYGQPLLTDDGAVSAVAFSPNGSLLAVAAGRTVTVWNIRAGRLSGRPLQFLRPPTAVTFAEQGRLLVTAAGDGVRLFDVGTRRQVGHVFGSSTGVLAISHDGKTLAAGGLGSGRVTLWDLGAGGRQQTTFDTRTHAYDHASKVTGLAFSWDGRAVAASGDQSAGVWSAITGKLIGRRLHDRKGKLVVDARAIGFGPAGDTLIVAADDFGIDTGLGIWQSASPHRYLGGVAGDGSFLDSFAVSADGRTAASGDYFGAVTLYDIASRRERPARLLAYPHPFDALDFSPDGALLAAGDRDGQTTLWDPSDGSQSGAPFVITDGGLAAAICASPAGCGNNDVTALAFTPDGSELSATNDWPALTTWTIADHRQTAPSRDLGAGENDSMLTAFEPDGLTVNEVGLNFAGDFIGFNGKEVPSALGDFVSSVAVSPDGTVFATGGYELFYYSTVTRTQQGIGQSDPDYYRRAFTGIAFSPDGKTLAAAGSDGTLSFWNTTTHLQLGNPVKVSPLPLDSVAYSRDGRYLTTGGYDWTVRLFDTRTHAQIRPPFLTDGPVDQVAFSPDGRLIAAAGIGGVDVFELAGGSRRRLTP